MRAKERLPTVLCSVPGCGKTAPLECNECGLPWDSSGPEADEAGCHCHPKVRTYSFQIPVHWEVSGSMEVQATSLEQACELAMDCSELPSGCYVDSSFEVNEDVAPLINEPTLEIIKVDQASLEDLPLLVGQLKTRRASDRLEQRLKEEA